MEALRTHLWWIALAVIAIALVIAFFRYGNMTADHQGFRDFRAHHAQRSVRPHPASALFRGILKNQTGDIIQRCTSDVDMIRNFVTEQLIQLFRVAVLLVLGLSFMIRMNWRLSMVALASIPIVVGYSTYFHRHISKRFTECDESEGRLSTIAQENLTGVRVVRAFGREVYEKERFDKENEHMTELWVKLSGSLSHFWAIGDCVSMIQVMLIIVLGTVMCVRGRYDLPASWSLFISYNSMLIWLAPFSWAAPSPK
ncbi:MAG: ABC transporter ATP-binding protein [Holdemanella sp.]|uniref:ABC transporter ATP-binding protein n=1 Tax=Holdemanella sp. TaxID=1971762 RepID=UPI0039946866